MWTVVGLIGVIAAVGILTWWFDPLRHFEANMAARESLTDSAMFATFFEREAIPSEIPIRIRQILAKHMEYDATKLRPDDDLNVYWNEFDMIDVFNELEAGFGITINNRDAEGTTCTIRSISHLVFSKVNLTTA
jgi:acyl carrier protein